jgi:hypothetical protein
LSCYNPDTNHRSESGSLNGVNPTGVVP